MEIPKKLIFNEISENLDLGYMSCLTPPCDPLAEEAAQHLGSAAANPKRPPTAGRMTDTDG
jgi:hypothetical protein